MPGLSRLASVSGVGLSSGRAALARVGRAGSFFGLSGDLAIAQIWGESRDGERGCIRAGSDGIRPIDTIGNSAPFAASSTAPWSRGASVAALNCELRPEIETVSPDQSRGQNRPRELHP